MLLRTTQVLFSLALTYAIGVIPAVADDHNHYNNGNHYGYNKHAKKVWKQQRKAAIRHSNSWQDDRALYRQHWNRVSASQQRQYDAQMRQQWLAYHHNKWNGNYSWSNYSDPAFLDYVHTSNPSLLTSIRNIVGF